LTGLAETAALLGEVFPGARVAGEEYLRWLYEESPFGEVVESNSEDQLGRTGHYALVPIALRRDGSPVSGALSLNTAVHERARGAGTFVRLAEQTYASAAQRGIEVVLGVANANSTHGFVKRLGFELVSALPVTVLLATPGGSGGVRSAWADAGAFQAGGIADGIGPLLAGPSAGVARSWSPETLRWRLADPTARYSLHRSGRALAVACRDQRHGVGVAVLLKLFAASPVDGSTSRALVRAACRFHRAPLALHAGVSDLVTFRGIPLPARLRDAPLNLIYRSLDGAPRSSPITRFEFLDFDAY